MSRAKHPDMREGKPNKAAVKAAPVRNVAFVTPDMPDTLEDADTWAAIWELGGPAGVFNPVADYGLISRYCSLLERRELLMAEIAAEGWTTTGAAGQKVVHPVAKLLNDVEVRLVGLEDRIGLSPQARNTITLGAAQASSAFESWLND